MVLWFVATAIASSAAFLVAPDRRGPGAMAVRGLAVAIGTLLLVLLPFAWAWIERPFAGSGQVLGVATAFATARAMLADGAAMILLGNVFGIALAAWMRLHHELDVPLRRLVTEKLTLVLAGIVLVAAALPWLSANRDRISSIEIASLAKLTLQPASATQVPNAISSGSGDSVQRSGIDIAQYVTFAREFTGLAAIRRDLEIAASLPGAGPPLMVDAVLLNRLPLTLDLMRRLEALLACVSAYVGHMRDYRLFLVDVRPVLLELDRVNRYRVEGLTRHEPTQKLRDVAVTLAREARERIAGVPQAPPGIGAEERSKACAQLAAGMFSPDALRSIPGGDRLDRLNPYPVIVLGYLYGAIGSHETAIDELLSHVDRIRTEIANGVPPEDRPFLLWFALRAMIEASVLAEQNTFVPHRPEEMRRLLAIALELVEEGRVPDPTDFASRCTAREVSAPERRAVFTSLTLRSRLLQAAAAAGRVGAAELLEARRLTDIDLNRCFGGLFRQSGGDFLSSVGATLQVTRARIMLGWSATARLDRRISDDEARMLVRDARDSAITAVALLEALTRREAAPLIAVRNGTMEPLSARLRRTSYEAQLSEARSTLQQALALAH